jgi:hypothetical protein
MRSDVKNEIANAIKNEVIPAIQSSRDEILKKEAQTQMWIKGIAWLAVFTLVLAAIRSLY